MLKAEPYSQQSITVSSSLLQIYHVIKTNSHRWIHTSVNDIVCLPACWSLQVSYRAIRNITNHVVAQSSMGHYEWQMEEDA